MKIKKVCYVNSQTFAKKHDLKNDCLEYAFLGRSNVGKSSLINLLTGRKRLALTSSTPGKTRMINYFLVNDKWYLVDLPGYGYSQGGKQERKRLLEIVNSYLFSSQFLTCLFLLIDSSLTPQKIDLEWIHFLGMNRIPFAIIFAKTDKLSNRQLNINEENYRNILLETWENLPPIFRTSSKQNIGKEEILAYIREINENSLMRS